MKGNYYYKLLLQISVNGLKYYMLSYGTDRIYATCGFRSVAPSSISGSGFSAAQDATSPMSPVENYLYKFDGRRRKYTIEQFVDAIEFCFIDVQSCTSTAQRFRWKHDTN